MIELYKITEGNSTKATITSAVDSVVFGGETYVPTAVKRSKIISRPDLLQNRITLQMSVHEMLGLDLLAEVNNNLAHRLIIYRGEGTNFEQIWAGSLIEQGCSGEVATITYGGGGISLRQLGDRRPFQRRCPFILYDSSTCRATPQTASVRVTGINSTKDILLVSGLGSSEVGYYTGGVLCPSAVYNPDNAGNSFISSHNKTAGDDQIRLTTPVQVSVGDNLSVLAGCDRTWQTCYSKFNNIVNFGGFPYLPLENPYIAEVCSDDGATIPILRLGGNYAIYIALDSSGSMSRDANDQFLRYDLATFQADVEAFDAHSRFAIARNQVKFIARNVVNGLAAGGGTAVFQIDMWSSSWSRAVNRQLNLSAPLTSSSLPIIDSWFETVPPGFETPLEGALSTWSTLGSRFLAGRTDFSLPFSRAETWFAQNNSADRINIMLFITDGRADPANSVNIAANSPIVTKTAPFAPPLDVNTYGINIRLQETSNTERIVNTNTPVAVVTVADPDLYYRILFIEDRAAE